MHKSVRRRMLSVKVTFKSVLILQLFTFIDNALT